MRAATKKIKHALLLLQCILVHVGTVVKANVNIFCWQQAKLSCRWLDQR